MNFETVLFAVAFFLLAIFTQPRNDVFLTDRAEFEENSFIPISYEGHWEVIRQIDVASGTSWRCR